MPDIEQQLAALELLEEAELIVLQNNYRELAAAPVVGYEPIWQEYTDAANAIQLKYAQLRWDAKRKHVDRCHDAELRLLVAHGYPQRDHVRLPRFTFWDIIRGLLGF